MQSDTVIGIVGAVVLVAVMVGVFAYEYNNAPAPEEAGPDPDSDEGKMEAFNATYPSLVATEDLDGDGEANYNDTDLDDDGILNAADNRTCICNQTFAGSVATTSSSTPPANTANKFMVSTGATGGSVTVSWTVTRDPATQGAIDDLTVSIDGGPSACTKMDGTGNQRMAMCDLAGIEPGEYTIRVVHANPVAAQAKPFTGLYSVEY